MALCAMLCITANGRLLAQTQDTPRSASVLVVDVQPADGGAEVMRKGAAQWDRAYTNQVLYPGDQVRTKENGRLTLRWFDNSNVRLPPLSDLLIEESAGTKPQASFNLLKGLLYLFHRDKPTEARFNTRTASAAVRGTEFILEFREPEGRTLLTVLDGEVELSNPQGRTNLVSGEQGLAEPGRAPSKTAVLRAVSTIQWLLYYPGVLDVHELELGAAEQQALADSLAAYRRGDLLGALAKYPAGRQPASAAEQVYFGAVLLAVGQVEHTEKVLDSLPAEEDRDSRVSRLAQALRRLIAAVTQPAPPSTPSTQPATRLATEWLADSYCHQSRSDLTNALHAARQAVAQSPQFGLGWTRVAELEFSFGHTTKALEALDKALQFSPSNAQAVALKGYLLSARNNISEAILWFDKAIALDGGLGNAWLGRGLCQIRQGHINAGKDDLQMAVTMEPQRALLRSYLSKTYSEARDRKRARHEIALAREKDPNDPTGWLYSALLNQEENRINEAVSDLEKSQELNDNRSVYRSRLLLDQDRAVRGANLAAIYRDAGMFDVSVREAARAVNVDYANYSAHLFLANSYNQMLDPRQVNQRYETARVDEYLVATLLAPVGAGVLSPAVSQQEYSKLFEQEGWGFFSSTEYLSRGAWQEYAAQYGRFGNLSYALDIYYRYDNGQYANNDLEIVSPSLVLKQQITPQDSVYVQALYSEAKFGDVAQYYDPFNSTNGANPWVRSRETQEPLLLAGYHHEWAPGNHTLALAGWLQDSLRVENPSQGTLALTRDTNNVVTRVIPYVAGQEYRSDLEIYTLEAQQIFQRERYALILGAHYQGGSFDTHNSNSIYFYTNAAGTVIPPSWFPSPLEQDYDHEFQRVNVYAYAHWQVADPLRLIAGVGYDWLKYPEDFRFAPISDGEQTTDLVSPKAGLIFTPLPDSTIRAAYSRSLGGASLDQSFQLEPSQVAGFNQAWRSIIPESVVGANAGAQFDAWNVSLEQKFPTHTYLGLSGELLQSQVDREIGVFNRPGTAVFPAPPPYYFPSTTPEELDYEERSLTFTVNQLVGQSWAFGASYRLSQAELQGHFPDIPATATVYGGFTPSRDWIATLHRVNLCAVYNHRSGFFAEGDSVWMHQSNEGYTPDLPGDDFWLFNAFIGYRFPRRQAELRLGLLNITDQDYRLNPLNLMSELPRERTLVVSGRFSF